MTIGFWSLSAVLVLTIATSLLPIGILQFHASVSAGLWYARSEAFMQQPLLATLRWVRTFGDVVSIVGALSVSWQVCRGLVGERTRRSAPVRETRAAHRLTRSYRAVPRRGDGPSCRTGCGVPAFV